jgi:hypothetical protein
MRQRANRLQLRARLAPPFLRSLLVALSGEQHNMPPAQSCTECGTETPSDSSCCTSCSSSTCDNATPTLSYIDHAEETSICGIESHREQITSLISTFAEVIPAISTLHLHNSTASRQLVELLNSAFSIRSALLSNSQSRLPEETELAFLRSAKAALASDVARSWLESLVQ